MQLLKTPLENIKNLRSEYFNSLPEFQELFLELMVCESYCYLLLDGEVVMGYTIINSNHILIEFYLSPKYLPNSNEILNHVIKELSVAEIYCKSFDLLLLNSCRLNSLRETVIGKLYREYVKPQMTIDPVIRTEKAGADSIKLLGRQDASIKELFDTEEQLISFIMNENVFEFYQNNEFAGCGMVIRTHPEYNFCDLGVWVSPLHRGKYFGTQILLRLRDFAISNHMIPSCGCAIENLASQKIIEKSGFVSNHTMIRFLANHH